MGVCAEVQATRGERKAAAAAQREHRRQGRGRADREMQDLSAIGLKQNVLHAETCGAERGRDEPPAGAGRRRKGVPRVAEGRPRRRRRGHGRSARLLLPERGAVENHRDDRGALHDLYQSNLAEMSQQQAKDDRADGHACEQHGAQKGDNARPRALRRKIGGQRESDRLNGVQSCAHEKERQSGSDLPRPEGSRRVAGEDEQRERHDREAAELRHRPEPDEGHAPPAKHGAVIVRTVTYQSPQRREQERQRQHAGDDP